MKDILYILDVINLSQGVYVFLIFILKREVLNACYIKYLEIRGRLPKNPITSLNDFMTARVTRQRSSGIPLNDIPFPRNQNQVPFPRECDQIPFPRDDNQEPFL